MRDALKITLAAHIPKKYRTKKTESVQGVDRYLPTLEEHMALLQAMSAQSFQTNKKKTSGKTGKMEEQENKTTVQSKNKTSKTVKMEETGKNTNGQSIQTLKSVKSEEK